MSATPPTVDLDAELLRAVRATVVEGFALVERLVATARWLEGAADDADAAGQEDPAAVRVLLADRPGASALIGSSDTSVAELMMEAGRLEAALLALQAVADERPAELRDLVRAGRPVNLEGRFFAVKYMIRENLPLSVRDPGSPLSGGTRNVSPAEMLWKRACAIASISDASPFPRFAHCKLDTTAHDWDHETDVVLAAGCSFVAVDERDGRTLVYLEDGSVATVATSALAPDDAEDREIAMSERRRSDDAGAPSEGAGDRWWDHDPAVRLTMELPGRLGCHVPERTRSFLKDHFRAHWRSRGVRCYPTGDARDSVDYEAALRPEAAGPLVREFFTDGSIDPELRRYFSFRTRRLSVAQAETVRAALADIEGLDAAGIVPEAQEARVPVPSGAPFDFNALDPAYDWRFEIGPDGDFVVGTPKRG